MRIILHFLRPGCVWGFLSLSALEENSMSSYRRLKGFSTRSLQIAIASVMLVLRKPTAAPPGTSKLINHFLIFISPNTSTAHLHSVLIAKFLPKLGDLTSCSGTNDCSECKRKTKIFTNWDLRAELSHYRLLPLIRVCLPISLVIQQPGTAI